MPTQKDLKRIEKEQDLEWAKAVKNRDGWMCVICNSQNKASAHHIIPRENRATRHNILNGITLCVLHHKFSLKISPHRNSVAFLKWLADNRFKQFEYVWEEISNGMELG